MQPADRADRVNGFRHDDSLIVDHIGIKQLIALHRQHICPHGNLIEIAARAADVLHPFLDAVERPQPGIAAQQQDAGRGAKGAQHLLAVGGPGQRDSPVVQMPQGFWHLDRHGHQIEIGIDALRIGALMAGNRRFWRQRVHDAALMAFPRVGGAAQQHTTGFQQQPGLFQRCQRAHDRSGVARYHTGALPVERSQIRRLGDKGMPGRRVLFAALHDEFQPGGPVGRDIGGGDRLWRGIDHHIGTGHHVEQPTADWQTRRTHHIVCGVAGGENGKAALHCNCNPPVCRDIGDPHNLHVGLAGHGIRHPLANDTIAVDGNAQLDFVWQRKCSLIDEYEPIAQRAIRLLLVEQAPSRRWRQMRIP